MTIRDKLNSIRKRILLLGLVGLLLVLMGVAAATSGDSPLLLAIAGSLVLFVAAFHLLVGVRCPRCGENVGRALIWPPRHWPLISGKIERCPFCEANFDEELSEDARRQS